MIGASDHGRVASIEDCYDIAKAEGNSVFALEDGQDTTTGNINAQCWTTATAKDTYQNNGASTGCNGAGTGGSYLISVYEISKNTLDV